MNRVFQLKQTFILLKHINTIHQNTGTKEQIDKKLQSTCIQFKKQDNKNIFNISNILITFTGFIFFIYKISYSTKFSLTNKINKFYSNISKMIVVFQIDFIETIYKLPKSIFDLSTQGIDFNLKYLAINRFDSKDNMD